MLHVEGCDGPFAILQGLFDSIGPNRWIAGVEVLEKDLATMPRVPFNRMLYFARDCYYRSMGSSVKLESWQPPEPDVAAIVNTPP